LDVSRTLNSKHLTICTFFVIMTLTVGFVVNCLSLRGTETVAWAFAHYNETMLGNRSMVFVKRRKGEPVDDHNVNDNTEEAAEWFISRFGEVHYHPDNEIDDAMREKDVDVCLVEMYGSNEEWVPKDIPSILHCVFRPLLKGTIPTGISNCVARGMISVLPNIVPHHHETTEDMREDLGIPKDAIVFARYGGYYQFNIEIAHIAVKNVSSRNPNVYFIFMNTHPFMEPTKNVIFLPGTRSLYQKKRFINTCDAYLHARADGETFGAAIAEFAMCDKNIITCRYQMDYFQNEHLCVLGKQCIMYDDQLQLEHILENYPMYKKDMTNNGYYAYTPEKVMPLFEQYLQRAVSAKKQS
jgi:hypothetical protein